MFSDKYRPEKCDLAVQNIVNAIRDLTTEEATSVLIGAYLGHLMFHSKNKEDIEKNIELTLIEIRIGVERNFENVKKLQMEAISTEGNA